MSPDNCEPRIEQNGGFCKYILKLKDHMFGSNLLRELANKGPSAFSVSSDCVTDQSIIYFFINSQ